MPSPHLDPCVPAGSPWPGSASPLPQAAASLGRCVFAACFVALGALSWIFGDFVVGRAPAWPEGLPGRVAFVWTTGAAFIGCGMALLARRREPEAAIVAGVLIFGWAVARLIPVVAADAFIGGSWTQLGKACVFLGGLAALVVPSMPERTVDGQRVGRIALGGFMILAGFQHFRWDEFVATLVPVWVPGGGAFWTYASGVLLILGGTGLCIARTAVVAALLSGLMILLWVPMLHIPRALAATGTSMSQNEWTAVFEATAFGGLAWFLAGVSCRRRPRDPVRRRATR